MHLLAIGTTLLLFRYSHNFHHLHLIRSSTFALQESIKLRCLSRTLMVGFPINAKSLNKAASYRVSSNWNLMKNTIDERTLSKTRNDSLMKHINWKKLESKRSVGHFCSGRKNWSWSSWFKYFVSFTTASPFTMRNGIEREHLFH